MMPAPELIHDGVRLYHGDALAVLATLPPASCDALVTDPPAGIGFMGKSWDTSGGRGAFVEALTPIFRECRRVLKPGAHGLVWALPRTAHWTATALEEAGFEIRDVVVHLFGSGFPKSLDVAKAIDKRRDDEADVRRVTTWIREARDRAGLTNADLDAAFGFAGMGGHWTARDSYSQPAVPTDAQWARLGELLAFGPDMDATVARLNARKGTPGEAWEARAVVGPYARDPGGFGEHRFRTADGLQRAEAVNGDAAQWQGWGTALKPASEHWILVRVPLAAGTVARNVLAHGTGALNVDGCRIAHASAGDLATSRAKNPGRDDLVTSGTYGADRPQQSVNDAGRWPANLVLSHCVECGDTCAADCPVALLDAQSGELTSGAREAGMYGRLGGHGRLNGWTAGPMPAIAGDAGGASRFFYCAKPSPAERNGDGAANRHPTVKPVALMRWLCRLVTPPGGTVLDPFVGSGTTLRAAHAEGFRAVGIDRDPEYVATAAARVPRQFDLFAPRDEGPA